MPEKKNIYSLAFTIILCSLVFYVEIENLKSTVITIDFDNHYDFIQIRKKGKVLHKSLKYFFFAPLLQIRRAHFQIK